MEVIQKPDLARWLIADIKKSWKHYGVKGVLPWKVFICFSLGVAGAYSMPMEFWCESGSKARLALYASLLTVNGLLIAFSLNSFTKIFEICLSDDFGKWLRDKDKAQEYISIVNFIQVTLTVAVAVTAISFVVSILQEVPIWASRIFLCTTFITTIYAFIYAVGAVRLMRDLVWYRIQAERVGILNEDD